MTDETRLEGIRHKVFMDRYAVKGMDGLPLEHTPEEMWRRVAAGIAAVESTPDTQNEWFEKFYELLRDFKFVPGGRILSGAGAGSGVSLYNCFVVGVGENPLDPAAPIKPQLDPVEAREAFFKALGEMTDIMARSGGVGMNLSALPPKGTPINAHGRGKSVRPTVALSIDHPDVSLLLDEKDGPNLKHVNVAVIVPPDVGLVSSVLWDRVVASGVTLLGSETPRMGIQDSRGGIIARAWDCALELFEGQSPIIDFSALRPKGAYIKTVNGTSSGPVAWMYLFDAVACLDDGASPTEKGAIWFAEIASVITGKTIQQGGTRRGALMVMLDDDHPDIEEFIAAKKIGPDGRPVMIEHANMSICVSDAFMNFVKNDLLWELKWQGEVVRTVRARDLWDKICTAAWTTAEPGIVFMERANKRSNTHYFENIRCVNPCGEQPLSPGSVCNLGAINLAQYVNEYGIMEEELIRDTKHAIRFLDNVIDATPYFTDLHVKMQRDGTRRTGLGTMGLADALIKLKVAYGSAKSLEWIDLLYSTIRDAAYEASIDLAEEKGAFPLFDRDEYLKGWFVDLLPGYIQAGIRSVGIRNGVLLTQAPTGTTSLLAGVSSGIEPVFDFAMKRVDRTGEHILYHPLYQAWLKSADTDAKKPSYFVGAKDLTPEEHVKVQARVQQYTDSSISKTVNGPNDSTVEDVKTLYMMAYDLGCKGVTYYRDGSRDAILTSVTETKPKTVMAQQAMPSAVPAWIAEGRLKNRPDEMAGFTRNITAPEGKVNITINADADGPLEVFINVGRAGSDIAALAEAMGRMISLQLRVPSTMSQENRLREVANQLRGIGGSRSIGFGKKRVLSLPDAVSQALMKHLDRNSSEEVKETKPVLTGNLCPQCGSSGSYVYEEGCKKCYNCAHSEC